MPLSKKEKEMSDSKSNSSGRIGFCGLLTIVFITLKLMKYIDWDWTWVLSPIWIPIAIALSFFFLAALLTGLFGRR